MDTGYWILNTGYLILDTKYWILDTKYWILNTGYEHACQNPNMIDGLGRHKNMLALLPI